MTQPKPTLVQRLKRIVREFLEPPDLFEGEPNLRDKPDWDVYFKQLEQQTKKEEP